jgi:hypothetical protein
MGDILSDALQDLGAVLGEVDKLVASLPVDLAGQFSKRRDDCLAQSIIVRYPCLYQLARDIEKALAGQGVRPPPVAPLPPPASTFPIIPVAIGGGLLLAGIVYLVLRKK